MGLAIRSNPFTGEDEFYDDGEASSGSTGAAYTPSNYVAPSSASSDGNAGESEAFQYISQSLQSTGLADSDLGSAFNYTTGSRAAAGRLSDTNTTGLVEGDQPKEEKSFFDKLKDGIGKAYDKDPIKALELGFGTVAGLYKTAEARKLQQSQAQAAIDQINQRYANDKDAQDRYTASLGSGGSRTNTKKPLTRQNGSRVYNTNGTLNRG